MSWHESEIVVRYADTDQMGVIHHASHLLYCEMGRINFCEHLGLPYHVLEEAGYYLMVSELTGRYRAPARYGEKLYIKTGIAVLKPKLIQFKYEIRNREENQLLFTGTSKHLFSQGTKAAVRLPAEFFAFFEKAYPAENP
ncbi:acyl-CoA thioesterase [Acanthopleuribacter pedis]|uniref:Acyl-CoA thioesterase n=1 Tax=Acanthopleuribacter pedis TaxID=442870 RepID=A0A8J7QFC2_9BACT|nr:thioesterase family protein [Acanthopleuribacter pedis]MBO1318815.1 acyl-CoA thioesterase [Acanthopleuribacter pedis]